MEATAEVLTDTLQPSEAARLLGDPHRVSGISKTWAGWRPSALANEASGFIAAQMLSVLPKSYGRRSQASRQTSCRSSIYLVAWT